MEHKKMTVNIFKKFLILDFSQNYKNITISKIQHKPTTRIITNLEVRYHEYNIFKKLGKSYPKISFLFCFQFYKPWYKNDKFYLKYLHTYFYSKLKFNQIVIFIISIFFLYLLVVFVYS